MGKNSQLIEQLSKALPRSSKTDPPPPSPESVAPAAPAMAAKSSISLYPRDLAQLDAIKQFMQSKGFRNIGDSEALRLACRAVTIGDNLIPLYEDMRQEDGRSRRWAS